MALQNIGASNRDDAFYRYKMPKLISKIEGRGNGIKTNLVNMVDVAKALCRPPSYTTKFFGCELGALSKFDEKTGTSIVNGSHDNAKLVALLEIFIKKYVQCYGCGNPETEIMISKSQMITMKCAACGFISDVDMRDKLTTFILKNPPEQKKGGSTKDKKALKKAEKEKKKKTGGQDETKKKTVSASDEEQHSSPPLSQAGEEDETAGEDEDVEWQTDTSALAAQQRIKELSEATRGMVMIEEPLEPTHNESKKAGLKPKKSSDKKVPELSVQGKLLKEFQTCLKNGFTPLQCASLLQSKKDVGEAAMVAYFAALFGDVSKGLAKEVEKKRLYVAKAVVDEESQIWLLKAIEAFCCSKASLSKEVPLVLKYLYDEDILEEEKILEWYSYGVGKATDLEAEPVWEYVKPFVVWLRTAESESEEEE